MLHIFFLQPKNAPLRSNISNLKTAVSSLKSNISNLRSFVFSLRSKVFCLRSKVFSLRSKVYCLMSTVLFLLWGWGAGAQIPTDERVQYEELTSKLSNNPSESLLGSIYDQILRYQNATLDREVILRQKLYYADAATRQLYTTKDSLLTQIGKAYERAGSRRATVTDMEQRVAALEQQIIERVQRDNTYFLNLSVRFAREAYRANPNLGCFTCYQKIKTKRGNQNLAHQLRRYAAQKEARPQRWQEVRNELEPADAAIEFVTYRDAASGAVWYGALVLRRHFNAPQFTPLCTRDELNTLLHKGNLDDELFQLYLYSPPDGEGAATLYNLLWEPILPHLKGAKRVFYAPAGDLHRLNIAAIQPHELAPPLQELWEFVRINSTRSLIGPYSRSTNKKNALPEVTLPCWNKMKVDPAMTARFFGSIEVDYYDPGLAATRKDAALFGNIYYDMDSIAIRNGLSIPRNIVAPAKNQRGRKSSQMDEWELLFGATEEILAIKKELRQHAYEARIYEGHAASEEAFKRLGDGTAASPRIIHVATHGFFLADSARHGSDNPMHRAGLILAGANHAWKNKRPMNGMEDGILTAFEISLLHLQNTELVVLSACETGLGFIENNEGVFGLQRAFKQAGVKNLIVSLWSVPDNATQMLMTRFYQNCLEKDMPIREALFAAQRWMREQKNYQNPYFWAGFVVLE
jgi:hypothetical protein